jgi:two-component SAPR family response regulator
MRRDMKTLIVDDNKISLEFLNEICMDSPYVYVAGTFADPEAAWKFAKDNYIELALLDVRMPKLNGIELGKRIRSIYPECVIIYVTAYKEPCIDAIRMKADFYIFKPYSSKDIEDAIYRARLLAVRQRKRIAVRTFGRFDVFAAGRPICFKNAKSKELLALCVDRRGGEVMMDEAIDMLWPERPYDERVKKLYRKSVLMLNHTLLEYGIEDIFISKRGYCYILPEKFECDYYDFIKQKNRIPPEEYMFQYPWAEETLASLCF